MPEPVDPHHLLLIGAGPGVGAGVVRRFGREGFRSTLISRSETLDQLAAELRSGGLQIETIGADIEDLDGYAADSPGAALNRPRGCHELRNRLAPRPLQGVFRSTARALAGTRKQRSQPAA